jgi:hypothetical protein
MLKSLVGKSWVPLTLSLGQGMKKINGNHAMWKDHEMDGSLFFPFFLFFFLFPFSISNAIVPSVERVENGMVRTSTNHSFRNQVPP